MTAPFKQAEPAPTRASEARLAETAASTWTAALGAVAAAVVFVGMTTTAPAAISITPIEGGGGDAVVQTNAYNFPASQFLVTDGTNVTIIASPGLTNIVGTGWTLHKGPVTNQGITVIDDLLTVLSNVTSTGSVSATGLVATTSDAAEGVTIYVNELTSSYALELPTTNGLDGQVLQTDGTALHWITLGTFEFTNNLISAGLTNSTRFGLTGPTQLPTTQSVVSVSAGRDITITNQGGTNLVFAFTGIGGALTGQYVFHDTQFSLVDDTNVFLKDGVRLTNAWVAGTLTNSGTTFLDGSTFVDNLLSVQSNVVASGYLRATGLVLNAGLNGVTVIPQSGTTEYTLLLPTTNGISGQILVTDGTVLRWSDQVASRTNAYNGNQFAVANGTNVAIKSGASVSNLFHYGDFTGSGDITNDGHLEIGNVNVLGTLYVNANIENTSIGDINGFVNISGSQDVTAGRYLVTDDALKLNDDDSSAYVLIRAAGVTAASYTNTWPSTNGLSGQILVNGGGTDLYWATPSAAQGFIASSSGQGTNTTLRGDLRLYVPADLSNEVIVQGGHEQSGTSAEFIVAGTNVAVLGGPTIALRRGNGPSHSGSSTTNGSVLGNIVFSGISSLGDASAGIIPSARIRAVAVGLQGAVGGGAYLSFQTGAEGLPAAPVEILRIERAGLNVTNNATIQSNLTVNQRLEVLASAAIYRPILTNGTNVGSAFSSLGTEDKAEQFGAGARATNEFATAVGNAATAGGNTSLAAGYLSAAFGLADVAVGGANVARGGSNTALGVLTFAIGTNSTALGFGAAVTNFRSAAIGANSFATEDFQIRIGTDTETVSLPGLIKWDDADGSHGFALRASATTTDNQTNSWPTTNALAGQSLHSDGSGQWYWATAEGFGGAITGAYIFNANQFTAVNETNISISSGAVITNLTTRTSVRNINVTTNEAAGFFNTTIVLNDDDASAGLTMQAAGTMASGYTLTWPATNGLNGQVAMNNGSGVLSWSDPPAFRTNAYNGNQFTVANGTNVAIKSGASLSNILHFGDWTGTGDLTNTGSAQISANLDVGGTLFVNANIENTSIGNIVGFTDIAAGGDVTAGDDIIATGDLAAGATLILNDDDASRAVSIQAASVTTSNYTITLPVTNGLAGQWMVLGSSPGVLEWRHLGGTNAYNGTQFSVANGTNVSLKSGAFLTNTATYGTVTNHANQLTPINTITYAATINVPFTNAANQITLTGDILLNTTNRVDGFMQDTTVLLWAGATNRVVRFNLSHHLQSGSYTNVLGSNSTAIVSFRQYGSSETNVFTSWAPEQ